MINAYLLYATPEGDADLLYLGRFQATDAFLAFRIGGKGVAILSPLEYSRAKKESCFDEIWNTQELEGKSLLDHVKFVQKHYKIDQFTVHETFPAGLYEKLKKAKIKICIQQGPLFEERLIKTKEEIKKLSVAAEASVAGLAGVGGILKKSSIKGNRLFFQKKVLTSEFLQAAVFQECLKLGALAKNTIVACGKQACDPHCRGSGPIAPHQLIVVDIFPRIEKTGYFGDMSRTFLKGTPSDAQSKLVEAVRTAQKKAIATIREGVITRSIHENIVHYFDSLGYQTGIVNGRHEGFFHSTGHGVGLDIHEAPRISTNDVTLKENMVVTVEPGLYYPEIGGVRIEDMICVKKQKSKIISNFHYDWIL